MFSRKNRELVLALILLVCLFCSREPRKVEKPYLTEAGPLALDELLFVRRQHERLLTPGTFLPVLRHLTPTQLYKDVIYLLTGITSHTFPFSQVTDKDE